jgi:uncharacterized protein YecT (DUF1311 family)
MSDQDQEHRERLRETIHQMNEQYGEVFRRLAQGEEPKHVEGSDEEFQAALDSVNERYGEALKRLADS